MMAHGSASVAETASASLRRLHLSACSSNPLPFQRPAFVHRPAVMAGRWRPLASRAPALQAIFLPTQQASCSASSTPLLKIADLPGVAHSLTSFFGARLDQLDSTSASHFRRSFRSTSQVSANAATLIEEAAKGEEENAAPAQRAGAYPFKELEAKWQKTWAERKTFRTPEEVDTSKPKFYALDMFPYPSGAGLHVGHPEGYTATDIVSRYKRMKGFNVLHPMGWDAFGLPAEQYALETGTHPKVTTERNVARFRTQLQSLGFSYDWDREFSTTDEKYYRWTQWIFLKLWENGLAYQAEVPVNWCPALGTVLANEEVIDGLSERGGHPVIRKPMRQWMLRITRYADRLLDDLEDLNWPESIKEMQRNWIGRSEGAEIDFPILAPDGAVTESSLRVFTTRPDTLFGATYMVVAPEHPLVEHVTSAEQREAVDEYVKKAALKSDLERTELQKEKTGVATWGYARNPATGEKVPIWVADYVLGSYGTGAIMAVPAHDTRDHEFATAFDLPIIQVVSPPKGNKVDSNEAFSEPGKAVNSSSEATGLKLDGLSTTKAAAKVIDWLESTKQGTKKVNYRLRDWLFARQRYWGEPFPMVYVDGASDPVPIPESELPLVLPETDSYKPSGTGESPLATITDWVNTTDPSGRPARRETNTMPQWAGSCWYFIRFIDPGNDQALVDPEKERYWGPVDLYVGGAEHAVLHLLYARFIYKFLFDIGVVSRKEPFQSLVNQGMILGEVEYTTFRNEGGERVSADVASSSRETYTPERIPESEVTKSGNEYVLRTDPGVRVQARAHKMSKSRGNVINPDDVVSEYGADSLRLYEMFMGPLKETKVWSTNGVEGVHRFLARAWRLVVGQKEGADVSVTENEPSEAQLRTLHACIQKVTEEVDNMRFNTGIAAMMEFVNAANKWDDRPRAALEPFVLLLSPFAPHIAEELWHRLGHPESLAYQPWPQAEEKYLAANSFVLPVQVNGKTRVTLELPVGIDQAAAMARALQEEAVAKYTDGKEIKKTIYVPGKILNLVVGK